MNVFSDDGLEFRVSARIEEPSKPIRLLQVSVPQGNRESSLEGRESLIRSKLRRVGKAAVEVGSAFSMRVLDLGQAGEQVRTSRSGQAFNEQLAARILLSLMLECVDCSQVEFRGFGQDLQTLAGRVLPCAEFCGFAQELRNILRW
jgi:hypothetical protein